MCICSQEWYREAEEQEVASTQSEVGTPLLLSKKSSRKEDDDAGAGVESSHIVHTHSVGENTSGITGVAGVEGTELGAVSAASGTTYSTIASVNSKADDVVMVQQGRGKSKRVEAVHLSHSSLHYDASEHQQQQQLISSPPSSSSLISSVASQHGPNQSATHPGMRVSFPSSQQNSTHASPFGSGQNIQALSPTSAEDWQLFAEERCRGPQELRGGVPNGTASTGGYFAQDMGNSTRYGHSSSSDAALVAQRRGGLQRQVQSEAATPAHIDSGSVSPRGGILSVSHSNLEYGRTLDAQQLQSRLSRFSGMRRQASLPEQPSPPHMSTVSSPWAIPPATAASIRMSDISSTPNTSSPASLPMTSSPAVRNGDDVRRRGRPSSVLGTLPVGQTAQEYQTGQ